MYDMTYYWQQDGLAHVPRAKSYKAFEWLCIVLEQAMLLRGLQKEEKEEEKSKASTSQDKGLL